jgi:hypothetical protein
VEKGKPEEQHELERLWSRYKYTNRSKGKRRRRS